MFRASVFLVALSFIAMPHGSVGQDKPQATMEGLDAKVVGAGDACPLTISSLRSEQTEVG